MTAWWVPPTLRGYRAAWLGADALAGLTLVAVALPGQMATAQLANLPAVAGLYAFVAGSLMYALLGANRHLSVGADSTIAPLLATGVAAVAAAGTSGYGSVMAFTALLVGALLVTVVSAVSGGSRSSCRRRSSPGSWPGSPSRSLSARSRSSSG